MRKAPPAADEAARKAELRRRIEAAILEEARAVQNESVERAMARGAAMKRAAAAAVEREAGDQAQTGQKLTSTRSRNVAPAGGGAFVK